MDEFQQRLIAFLSLIMEGTETGRYLWREHKDKSPEWQKVLSAPFANIEQIYRLFVSEPIPVTVDGQTINKQFYVVKKSKAAAAPCVIDKNSHDYPYIFLGCDNGEIVAVIDIVMIEFSSMLQALYETIDNAIFPKEKAIQDFENGLGIGDK